MKNLKTQGFVLLDVDVVALNNAGKSETTLNDNGVATKTITKNGQRYAYVSGQAWRYWWRESLQKNCGWKLSPVIRDSKIAYTNANPVEYADDDVFGYMRAATEIIKKQQRKGKERKYHGDPGIAFKKFGHCFGCFGYSYGKLVEYGTSGRGFGSLQQAGVQCGDERNV